MSDDKYVVMKAEDWEKMPFAPNHTSGILTDAVVIRTQDIFAGPGLSAYANAIQTGIDLMREFGGMEDALELIGELEEIRDYFHERAQEALMHPHKKIPD
jgi:hypothetical protein